MSEKKSRLRTATGARRTANITIQDINIDSNENIQ